MHMPMTSRCGGQGPYVRSWHGEGTRLVVWHMWPMVFVAWLLFMLGMMMGAKKSMMMQGMSRMTGGGYGGMGHGGGMGPRMMGKMMHHHHGMGGPCGCPEGHGSQPERGPERPEGGG